jgi:thioredoxin reductase
MLRVIPGDVVGRHAPRSDPADDPEEVRHVLVDDATSETSVRGLFAVGDMSRHRGRNRGQVT